MTGREDPGGEVAQAPPRPRRRAVGPVGARPGAPDGGAVPGWSGPLDAPEDDDERLLREVPPHHGT